MIEKVRKLIHRHVELANLLSTPEVMNDRKKMEEFGREYANVGKMLPTFNDYVDTVDRIEEARRLLKTESDHDLISLAEEEVHDLELRLPGLEDKVKTLLVPRDPADSKNAIVEIRAGTGGTEAGIFAADLYRMYTSYVEAKGWSYDVMSTSAGDKGAI